ncbi:hypothetical protein IT396_01110 [Candidatus Nomurabacteria bacterium]|nr:hypothetical protein [Candidatus Nomurabacteria bacterium]
MNPAISAGFNMKGVPMDLNTYDRNDYILAGTDNAPVPLIDLSGEKTSGYRFIGGKDTDNK